MAPTHRISSPHENLMYHTVTIFSRGIRVSVTRSEISPRENSYLRNTDTLRRITACGQKENNRTYEKTDIIDTGNTTAR
jgi:hypothetical protein